MRALSLLAARRLGQAQCAVRRVARPAAAVSLIQGQELEQLPGARPAALRLAHGWARAARGLALEGAAGTGARRAAGTYSKQAALPRLPVPPLRDTLERYVASVEALKGPGSPAVAATKAAVAAFEAEGGPALQTALEARAADAAAHPNWLEQWWDLGYLELRVSNLYVNPFLKLSDDHEGRIADAAAAAAGAAGGAPDPQIGRAARLVRASLDLWRALETETLPALTLGRGDAATPVCMSQAARMFGHARIPGEPCDALRCYATRPAGMPDHLQHWCTTWHSEVAPRHIAVLCNGRVYTCRVAGDGEARQPLRANEIAASLEAIRAHAAAAPPPSHPLATMTMTDRTSWAAVRARVEAASPRNAAAFHAVDSALFVLALDPAAPSTPRDTSMAMLLGGVQASDESARASVTVGDAVPRRDRWLDKHSVVVFANGVAGMNTEHAPGDGATFLVWLHAMANGSAKLLEAGDVGVPSGPAAEGAWAEVEWDLDDAARASVAEAEASVAGFASALKVHPLRFTAFGSGACKAWGVSPDGVAQMAIQLARARHFGELVATYESASTGQFLHGRTETIRSLTLPARAFVEAMRGLDEGAGAVRLAGEPDAAVLAAAGPLLRAAIEEHVRTAVRAKQGQGVDRHLFGLYMTAIGQAAGGGDAPTVDAAPQLPALFEDPSYAESSTWRLSTSQVPHFGLDMVGFSPVTADGCGVGYLMRPTDITFHLSSFGAPDVAHADSDAAGLAAQLELAMLDVAACLQGA